VLDGLASIYGRPVWQRVHDPTSELVLTILSQNSADVSAEHAFELLRRAYPTTSAAAGEAPPTGQGPIESSSSAGIIAPAADAEHVAGRPGKVTRPGWGGAGLDPEAPPDWGAIEHAEPSEVIETIRPGGLPTLKGPRIQAALRSLREARGDYSMEFLGDLPALEARDWLTSIGGIGRKTASVVLLFSFGLPLMPVDRHVERVSKRIGLLPPKVTADDAHAMFLALLEPAQMYEAHVNLITHGRQLCHARRPECERCPVATRCRYVDKKAP